jgi:protease-4
VRRELELARNAGKPVVVSMGDVAASGGFWISQAADEVLADPATVTGSIGVIGIMPTFDRTLDKLGVHAAGAGTSWLSTAMDPRQPLDPRFGSVLQLSIGHVYREFLARVAAARGSTPEQIDQVAQGRVWTGRQAQQRGLVDTLGGLHEALQSAARRAKLGDRFEVVYVQEEPRGLERWLRLLPETLARAVDLRLQGVLPAPLAQIGHELAWLQPRADPLSAVYAHCLCVAP